MQPVVAGVPGIGCPPSTVALVEEAPQLQVSPCVASSLRSPATHRGRAPSRGRARGRADVRI